VNGIDSRSGVWELKSSSAASAIESVISTQGDQEDRDGNFDPQNIRDGRERILSSIVRRRGQPKFRRDLLKFYGGRCAITGTDAEQALEAAHIIPYKGSDTNHPSNGLLLRADLHTLFDLKLIAIDTLTMTVLIAPALQHTSYQKLAGAPLHLPSNQSARPSVQALDAHRSETGL
jgi:predicted restriction endonuclease